MKEVKRLCDPTGMLNPGVVLSDDPTSYIQDLKLVVSALPLHHRRRVAVRHAVNDDFAGAWASWQPQDVRGWEDEITLSTRSRN